MIPVVWYFNDGFWDAAFPSFVLDQAALCHHIMGIDGAAEHKNSIGVIVIPGQHCTENYEEINKAAGYFKRIVFVITGDEEAKFRADRLKHDDKKIWWFAPPLFPPQRINQTAPFGWPGDALPMIGRALRHSYERIYDYSFAGQVTHERRKQCLAAAHQMTERGFLFPTSGFAHGMGRENYYDIMVRSKFVLCPSGPCLPDSFRFAEALECGCVPIVDGLCPIPGYPEGYWNYLFDDYPFPVVTDWSTLPQLIAQILPRFPELQRTCSSWWQLQKDRYVLSMQEHLCRT